MEHHDTDRLASRRRRLLVTGRRRAARPRARRGVRRRRGDRARPRGLGRLAAAAAVCRGRARAAHGGLDRRRRRRGRSAAGRRRERRRRRQRRVAGCAARRLLDRLRLRRSQAGAVCRVGRAESALGLRSHEAARRGGGRRARLDRPELVALRRRPVTTSSGRCSGSAPSATRSLSWTTSVAARPTSGTSRAACAAWSTATGRDGVWHIAAAGDCTLGRVRRGDLRGGGYRLPRPADLDARSSGGRRRDPRTRSCAASVRARPSCRTGVTVCASASPAWRDRLSSAALRLGAGREGSRHRRRRLHRLAFRPAAGRGGRRRRRARQAHLRRQSGQSGGRRRRARGRRHRRRRRRSHASGAGCDAVVNFAAETHVDRSILGAGEFVHTNVVGTQTLLEWARETGRPARAGLDRRGLRRSRGRRPVARDGSAAPVQPVLGHEGGRRPARPRLRAHVRRQRVGHARREHVRPAAVSRRS